MLLPLVFYAIIQKIVKGHFAPLCMQETVFDSDITDWRKKHEQTYRSSCGTSQCGKVHAV